MLFTPPDFVIAEVVAKEHAVVGYRVGTLIPCPSAATVFELLCESARYADATLHDFFQKLKTLHA